VVFPEPVIPSDAANLTSAANWANNGQAKLRASMLELGLLGAIVIVLVISIHTFEKASLRTKNRKPRDPKIARAQSQAGATPA
jgi:hypothetical protein